MGRRQQWVYTIEPAGRPSDFPERLQRFKDEAGLTWRGLARMQRVNVRTVRRWRSGTMPGSGHLLALLEAAAREDLLHHFLPAAGEPRRPQEHVGEPAIDRDARPAPEQRRRIPREPGRTGIVSACESGRTILPSIVRSRETCRRRNIRTVDSSLRAHRPEDPCRV